MKCENCKREMRHVQSIEPVSDLVICDDCLTYVKAGAISVLRVAAIVLPSQPAQ